MHAAPTRTSLVLRDIASSVESRKQIALLIQTVLLVIVGMLVNVSCSISRYARTCVVVCETHFHVIGLSNVHGNPSILSIKFAENVIATNRHKVGADWMNIVEIIFARLTGPLDCGCICHVSNSF